MALPPRPLERLTPIHADLNLRAVPTTVMTLKDQEALQISVWNLFSCPEGELWGEPDFGADPGDLMWRQLVQGNATHFLNHLRRQVDLWLAPDIVMDVDNSSIAPDPAGRRAFVGTLAFIATKLDRPLFLDYQLNLSAS